jgi:HEAT repeat protein
VAIIRALAGLRDADAVPLLTKLAEDENASVAKAAATALLEVDRKGNAEVARKMAADPNPLARIEAAEALLKQDNPEGYKGLKAELELKQSAYRSRVILALGQARRKESVEMLLPYIDDPDPAVGPNARRSLLQVLAALHPYLKFDDKASAEKIRAWWEKNR